jgi:hypothetical protein
VEDDLKECRNKRCKRKGVIVDRPNSRYCSVCGAKLKMVWTTERDGLTLHPIIDMDPDVANRRPNKGGDQMRIGQKITYSDWKGTYQSYLMYEQWFDGKLTDDEYGAKLIAEHKGRQRGEDKEDRPKVHILAPKNDVFTCGDAYVKDCPLVGKPKHLAQMPHAMYLAWQFLATKHSTEWIAYLKGCKDPATNLWIINDMYFPKQRAHGTHVDAEDGEIQPDTIGTVHSHVRMSAYFSPEDRAHFNHDIEIVVNSSGNLAISCKIKLECGKLSRVEGDGAQMLLSADTYSDNLDKQLTAQLTEESAHKTSTSITKYGDGAN